MKAKTELTKAFYSPSELAQLLGLHPDTILNYIHSGKVFAIQLSARTYRIPRRQVQRLVAPETVRPPRIIELRGEEAGKAIEQFERDIREEVEAFERRHGAAARPSRR